MDSNEIVTILIADDDEDDQLMISEALMETNVTCNMCFVSDGEELIGYLSRRDQFINPQDSPRPDLILLDLNMPRKDGREALKEIKANPDLRRIPIIVFTTSKAPEDICRSYDDGVNSFITKPVSFDKLVDIMKTVAKYWFDLVRLPAQ